MRNNIDAMLLRSARIATGVAIVFVVAVYAFYASAGYFSFPLKGPERSIYSCLAEGFNAHQLSIAVNVDPRLLRLPNPYEMNARIGIPYIWDASLYHGKYYLYFTPLPALLFYLPVRLVFGRYPLDEFAGLVFSSVAFLFLVAAAHRALREVRERALLPFPVWVLIIGLGTLMPYVATLFRMYEVAIVMAMMFSSAWAHALVRYMFTRSIAAAAFMGLFAALAFNARPNLSVIIVISVAAILMTRDRQKILRSCTALAIPIALVLLAMAAYNYARFGSVFEFGVSYQLTVMPMRGHSVCSLCRLPELARFVNTTVHYVFWPPTIGSGFPFAELHGSYLDPAVSYPGYAETVGGVACITPVTLIGTFCAGLLALRWRDIDTGARAGVLVISAAWLVLFGLATCWWVVTRYELDFYGLMVIGSAICIERAASMLSRLGFAIAPLRVICWILIVYSIVLNLLLGLSGPGYTFKSRNPGLYGRLEAMLTRH